MSSTIFTRAFDRRVRTLLAVLGISVVVGGAFGTHTLWQANLEEGYMPEQPIDFAHSIMAGTHQIDCLYCHTQAMKGPHAGIPTVSDCMKCHTEIQTKDSQGQLKTGIAQLNEHFREKKPIEWIKAHLDRMAALKLNRFHWHLCDDQAWRLRIERYPRLTDIAAWRGEGNQRYGGFYTADEVREVVDYARRRYIEVVPEIEMPGHCNAALLAYPELSCTGEPLPVAPGGGWDAYTRDAGRRAFCAGRPEVLTFLEHVLEEVAAAFDGPYVHIGGDETPREAWDKCPRCRAAMQERGGDDSAALRVHMLSHMHRFCRERLGRRSIAWTDGVSDALPQDQIVHAWFPEEAGKAARLGHDVINSNHTRTYLDYPATDADAANKPDWMIVLPVEKVYGFDPLADGVDAGDAGRVLGSEAPLWTEHAPDDASMEHQLMPRLAAFAEALWSPLEGRDFADFQRRIAMHQTCGTFEVAGAATAEVR